MIYLPCDPLYLTLHPLYLCHQKCGINYSTTTLCMISHRLYVWHPIQYACYHNNCLWHHTPLCTTSHPAYLWHHFQYICYHFSMITELRLIYKNIFYLYNSVEWSKNEIKRTISICNRIQKNEILINIFNKRYAKFVY